MARVVVRGGLPRAEEGVSERVRGREREIGREREGARERERGFRTSDWWREKERGKA